MVVYGVKFISQAALRAYLNSIRSIYITPVNPGSFMCFHASYLTHTGNYNSLLEEMSHDMRRYNIYFYNLESALKKNESILLYHLTQLHYSKNQNIIANLLMMNESYTILSKKLPFDIRPPAIHC